MHSCIEGTRVRAAAWSFDSQLLGIVLETQRPRDLGSRRGKRRWKATSGSKGHLLRFCFQNCISTATLSKARQARRGVLLRLPQLRQEVFISGSKTAQDPFAEVDHLGYKGSTHLLQLTRAWCRYLEVSGHLSRLCPVQLQLQSFNFTASTPSSHLKPLRVSKLQP